MDIEFGIEKLLEPYSVAGTEKEPRKLSLEDISSELINRFRIPHDVAGSAIWITFHRLAHDNLFFKDDGTFDGKARQLLIYIRNEANDILKRRSKALVKDEIVKITTCMNIGCKHRTGTMKKKTRFNKVMDSLLKPRKMFWMPTWRI